MYNVPVIVVCRERRRSRFFSLLYNLFVGIRSGIKQRTKSSGPPHLRETPPCRAAVCGAPEWMEHAQEPGLSTAPRQAQASPSNALASVPSHSSSAWRIHTRHARGRSSRAARAVGGIAKRISGHGFRRFSRELGAARQLAVCRWSDDLSVRTHSRGAWWTARALRVALSHCAWSKRLSSRVIY